MTKVIRIGIASEQAGPELVDAFCAAMANVAGTFGDREARALELGNELARRWIERDLQAQADTFADEVVIDGRQYARQQRGACRYHTLAGPVVVHRETFRIVGMHNGPTVVPLEVGAGLCERATPALAFSITQGFAERPLRHYEVEMRAAYRHSPSRSTLERIGKRVGAALETMVSGAEPTIRNAEPVLSEVASLSVGLDRTSVPMAEVTGPVALHPPRIRRPPPPVTVAYRMAYVATVSAHDHDGNVLLTQRFAATPTEGTDRLLSRIGAELRHLQDRYAGVPTAVVQDGAPELWNLIAHLRDRHGVVIDHERIDRFHVDERLAAVCELVTRDAWTATQLRESWRACLDRSDTAVDRIIRRLDELVAHLWFGVIEGTPMPAFWSKRVPSSISHATLTLIGGHIEYLRKQRHRIRYAGARRRGHPIGSGPTEGACKSVVAMRFKRSGQRWFETGLAPCLFLRSLHLSARLRPCFEILQATQIASLRAA